MDVQVIGRPEVASVEGRTDTWCGLDPPHWEHKYHDILWSHRTPMLGFWGNQRVEECCRYHTIQQSSYKRFTGGGHEISPLSVHKREREKQKKSHNYMDLMKDMQIMVPVEICHIWKLVMPWLLTLICLRWAGRAPGSGIWGILNLSTIASLLMAESQHINNENVN